MTINPKHGCEVCRGTGRSFIEDANGTLTEIECQYCHGRKDSTWVAERAQVRQVAERNHRWGLKAGILAYWGFLYLTRNWSWWHLGGNGPDLAQLVQVAFWLVGFALIVVWFVNPAPAPPKTRRPDHFTTDHERNVATAWMAGIALKGVYDRHRHQTEQRLDQIIKNQEGQKHA